MATSQNGWTATPDLALRPLVVAGVEFPPGVRDDDDVHTVLSYVATQFHTRVEDLVSPGCWGYNYRANANDPNSLSNHSSGTAIDVNAPQHPNGVATNVTFTDVEIDTIHRILREVDYTIRWGGDYTQTPDAMHFEVNVAKDELHATAERIRNTPVTEDELRDIAHRVNLTLGDYNDAGEPRDNTDGEPERANQRLRHIENKVDQLAEQVGKILKAVT